MNMYPISVSLTPQIQTVPPPVQLRQASIQSLHLLWGHLPEKQDISSPKVSVPFRLI